MSDWRSRPRNGRSQFNPLLGNIAERRRLGQTVRQMHNELTKEGHITLGYDQFIKYVRKAFPAVEPAAPRLTPSAGQHPFAPQAPAGALRRDTDDSLHPSLPDHSKIYGTAAD